MHKFSLYISSSKHREKEKSVLFFLKILLIVFIIGVFLFIVVMPQYRYSYTGSLLDKMNRLETIQEPKIVLIGNSNLAFGIDSEMIEKETGMPVVNMGLHGGLGNAFHEQMAKVNIHKNDIIIISHLTYCDDDKLQDPVLAWTTVENHLNLWKLIRPKDYLDMIYAYPTYANKAIKKWAWKESDEPNYGDYYNRQAFNEYGDVALERTDNNYTFTEGSISVPEINDTCVKRLNELNDYIEERGAYMLIAAYPIADGEYTPPRAEYVEFQEELESKLDSPVISDFTQYFFDYRYFFDTNYHMTTEGAKLRTQQLIEDILKWERGK